MWKYCTSRGGEKSCSAFLDILGRSTFAGGDAKCPIGVEGQSNGQW